MTGARNFRVWRSALTTAWNVSLTPRDWAGHVRTPERFPLKEIHCPSEPSRHCAIAPFFQQPTTVVPRRIWSRILAASGFPAALETLTVQRHGWSTTGFGELVVMVARIGAAATAGTARTNVRDRATRQRARTP